MIQKGKVLRIKVSASRKRQIVAAAKKRGLPLSVFIRVALYKGAALF